MVYRPAISSLRIPESGPPDEIAPFLKINKEFKMAEAILRRKAELDKNKNEQKKIKKQQKEKNKSHELSWETLMQSKTLPAIKINNKTMPQTWYHKRMTQFDRFTELKSLYERFKIIHQRQKAFIDDKSVGWEDFPASLIENLRTYEMLPSDELIKLAISSKFRLSDTGQTLEEERARWVLADTFLATSEWRNYDYVDMINDRNEEVSRFASRASSEGDASQPDGEPTPEGASIDGDGATQGAQNVSVSDGEVLVDTSSSEDEQDTIAEQQTGPTGNPASDASHHSDESDEEYSPSEAESESSHSAPKGSPKGKPKGDPDDDASSPSDSSS